MSDEYPQLPTELDRREIIDFDPHKVRKNQAKADALIDAAAAIGNWEAMEAATREKVDEIAETVRWWDSSVQRAGGNIFIRPGPGRMTLEQAEKVCSYPHQQISKWRKALKDRAAFEAAIVEGARRKALRRVDQKGASGTGENEWYTPPEILEAARDVMGEFDLDPASSSAAQQNVQAKQFFTRKDNGLTQDWHGRVWLNPPYMQPFIAQFATKMVAEVRAGRVTAAIMLTHNYTDTGWFHELAGQCEAICFTRGRIKFYDADGNVAAPTQGQAFFYFGEDIRGFAERFVKIGFVVIPNTGEVS